MRAEPLDPDLFDRLLDHRPDGPAAHALFDLAGREGEQVVEGLRIVPARVGRSDRVQRHPAEDGLGMGKDMEELFGVGRATARTLMEAIGEVQPVGGAHFVARSSLLGFLDAMIDAPKFDQACRSRVLETDEPHSPKPVRIALPADLRSVMLRDLPAHISLSPGPLEITAYSAVAMLESLTLPYCGANERVGQQHAIFGS